MISLCLLIGIGFAVYYTMPEPTPITILIRMMEEQENWFTENIISKFEKEEHCKVIIKPFRLDHDIGDILKQEAAEKNRDNISLVKAPFLVTLLLYKEDLLRSYNDVLAEDKRKKEYEIETEIADIYEQYSPTAIKMGTFGDITTRGLYFLPRKLETRLLIYRKSKVANAVVIWHKFRAEIEELLKKENGYGLPKGYKLEKDVVEWDYYDLFVVGYCWANTQIGGRKLPRIAHRSKNYSGTVLGLIDRALQLGASAEDIEDRYKYSDGIVDMFQWEAIFRKYNLYCEDMWQEDGLSGGGIYDGMKKETTYMAWMHQLDCLLIHGSEDQNIKGYLADKDDLGVAVVPRAVSFELTDIGLPKRIGTRESHTSGWFWGIPKNAPEPELAFKLATYITSHEKHREECEAFLILPVRNSVVDEMNRNPTRGWGNEVHTKSIEQLRLNGHCFVPRFKTLSEYRVFLQHYYNAFEDIVIKRRYSAEGPEGRVDREFIRENIR